jgi:hypothetical protein
LTHKSNIFLPVLCRTTIYASRLVDDFNNPNLMRFGTPYPGAIEAGCGPMRGAANAEMKHTAAGLRSSWAAAHHYMDETIQRRNELLEQYKNEPKITSTTTTSTDSESTPVTSDEKSSV